MDALLIIGIGVLALWCFTMWLLLKETWWGIRAQRKIREWRRRHEA